MIMTELNLKAFQLLDKEVYRLTIYDNSDEIIPEASLRGDLSPFQKVLMLTEMLNDESTVCTAILLRVLSANSTTNTDARKKILFQEYPEDVIKAVDLLHEMRLSRTLDQFHELLEKIKAQPTAKAVILAELKLHLILRSLLLTRGSEPEQSTQDTTAWETPYHEILIRALSQQSESTHHLKFVFTSEKQRLSISLKRRYPVELTDSWMIPVFDITCHLSLFGSEFIIDTIEPETLIQHILNWMTFHVRHLESSGVYLASPYIVIERNERVLGTAIKFIIHPETESEFILRLNKDMTSAFILYLKLKSDQISVEDEAVQTVMKKAEMKVLIQDYLMDYYPNKRIHTKLKMTPSKYQETLLISSNLL